MTVAAKNFNYPVNGLRGLCILMVFIFHVVNSKFLPEGSYGYADYFLRTFKYGVEIFFMISGYVIVNSIRRKPDLKIFFIDRALRIFPTWVPLHIITFFGAPFMGKVTVAAGTSIVVWICYFMSALLLMPPVIPTPLFHPAAWSLSYEWVFYIVTGTFVFLFQKNIPKNICLLILAFMALPLFNIFPRAIFFVSGALIAIYQPFVQSKSRVFAFSGIALILFLLAWAGTGANISEPDIRMTEWLLDNRILFALVAFIIGSYMFAGVVIGQGFLSVLLKTIPLQFYGKISYAFYLWSPMAFFITKYVTNRFLTSRIDLYVSFSFFVISAFLVSTFVAWLNWLFIEKRFTAVLKHKIFQPDKRYVTE